MASRALSRILSSGFKAGSRSLGAQIQAAQDKEERRRLRNQENLQALLGYSLVDERKARTKKLLEPEKEDIEYQIDIAPGLRAKTKSVEGLGKIAAGMGQDVETFLGGITDRKDISGVRISAETPGGRVSGPHDQANEVIAQMGGIAPDQENVTGIEDYVGIVEDRQKQTAEARNQAKSRILQAFPEVFEGLDWPKSATPEQLIDYLKEIFPSDIENPDSHWYNRRPKTIQNPDYEALQQLIGGVDIPEPYQAPTGPAAVALQDSISRAQTDPEIAGALMGGVTPDRETEMRQKGEGLNPREQQTLYYLLDNPEAVATYDWYSLKTAYPDINIEEIKKRLK